MRAYATKLEQEGGTDEDWEELYWMMERLVFLQEGRDEEEKF